MHEVTGANTLNLKGDCTGLAASGDYWLLNPPPGVNPQTGTLASIDGDGNTTWHAAKPRDTSTAAARPNAPGRFLWAHYRYVPPMAGFTDDEGATVGDMGTNKLGNYHCRNRVYDILQGRWTSPDPAVTPWTSLFSCVEQTPNRLADPSGWLTSHGDLGLGQGYGVYTNDGRCGVTALVVGQKYLQSAYSQPRTGQGGLHSTLSGGQDYFIGLELNGSFHPSGLCCCNQWGVVLFTRMTEFTGDSKRYVLGADTKHAAMAADGWALEEIGAGTIARNDSSSRRRDSCTTKDVVRFSDLPGFHLDNIIEAWGRGGLPWWHDKFVRRTIWEHRFCIVCLNGTGFGGCIDITFEADASGVRGVKVEGSYDLDAYNQHSALRAWRDAGGGSTLPEATRDTAWVD